MAIVNNALLLLVKLINDVHYQTISDAPTQVSATDIPNSTAVLKIVTLNVLD